LAKLVEVREFILLWTLRDAFCKPVTYRNTPCVAKAVIVATRVTHDLTLVTFNFMDFPTAGTHLLLVPRELVS
jgi:hypothetical protein